MRAAISQRRCSAVAHLHWRRAWRPIYLASMLAREGVVRRRRTRLPLRRTRLPLRAVGNRRVLLLPLPTEWVSNECRRRTRLHSFSRFAAFPIVAGRSTEDRPRAHRRRLPTIASILAVTMMLIPATKAGAISTVGNSGDGARTRDSLLGRQSIACSQPAR